jgi:hypothetical protein
MLSIEFEQQFRHQFVGRLLFDKLGHRHQRCGRHRFHIVSAVVKRRPIFGQPVLTRKCGPENGQQEWKARCLIFELGELAIASQPNLPNKFSASWPLPV